MKPIIGLRMDEVIGPPWAELLGDAVCPDADELDDSATLLARAMPTVADAKADAAAIFMNSRRCIVEAPDEDWPPDALGRPPM
jgi:hypothetical protein